MLIAEMFASVYQGIKASDSLTLRVLPADVLSINITEALDGGQIVTVIEKDGSVCVFAIEPPQALEEMQAEDGIH